MERIAHIGQQINDQYREYLESRPAVVKAVTFERESVDREFERRVAEKPDPAPRYPSY